MAMVGLNVEPAVTLLTYDVIVTDKVGQIKVLFWSITNFRVWRSVISALTV